MSRLLRPLQRTRRLLGIARILARYRIDDLLTDFPLLRPFKRLRILAPVGRRGIADAPAGARIRMALEELGPIFVKFGQIVSTRRDLLPPDIADELAKLQDDVPPFPGAQAVAIIERSLNKPLTELFAEFDTRALASASVAQVHAARTHDGREVVAKVIRPGMRKRIVRDLELLFALARFAEKYWQHGPRLRPVDVVEEFEKTIFDELDLQREAANCSLLGRNWQDSDDLYVPQVFWSHTTEDVFVMERIDGIAVDDVETLRREGYDLKKLAERGVRIFYTQVFRDNFFHADMHPGNIKVARDCPENPTYLSLDFGIMGSLPRADQYYLAQNFDAFFNRDYRRIARLHIESGWVPPNTRVEEFEAAIRTVCEPNFAKPLSEISFGVVLFKLFKVARRFNMEVQPQLVLLQKTLLNIEGLGRQTYPELDLWATAKPALEEIMSAQHGMHSARKTLQENLPRWLEHAVDMPMLMHEYLRQQTRHGRLLLEQVEPRGPGRSKPRNTRHDRSHRAGTFHAVISAGAMIATAILLQGTPVGVQWHGLALAPMLTGSLSALFLFLGWRAAR